MHPIRRKRPFLPKTKTGCLTCKIRKVKCDEGKPFCKRCTSTGRKCDGYSPSLTTRTPSPQSRALQIHPDLFRTAAERRIFSFFQLRASPQLAGQFHVLFWANELLQAAVHYPSVRHLVLALGSAYESFESRSSENAVARHHQGAQFAMLQSNQAIRDMDNLFQYQSTAGQTLERTCCILTASILFTYLASLQGNILQAMQHVRSGLKVLQDFESVDQSLLAKGPPYPVPVLRLRTILISIYGQLRTMINDEALFKWNHDPMVSHLEAVTYFSSIEEAHSYVERLFHNLLAFLQASEIRPPQTPKEFDAFNSRRRELSRSLKYSREALDALPFQGASKSGEGDDKGRIILRIYHILMDIRLRIDPLQAVSRESAFDAMQDQLEQILLLCEQLAGDDLGAHAIPSASSGLGIVLPLHTVAARCRNAHYRKRALKLLLSVNKRECLWDSLLTGRIATKTIEIEENAQKMAMTHPEAERAAFLEDSRVREVKVEFTKERKVLLRYLTVGDWKRGAIGMQHVIDW